MVLPDATVTRNLEQKEKREQISPAVGIIAETTSKKKKKQTIFKQRKKEKIKQVVQKM